MNKRLAERLAKAVRGEAVMIRQGDDLLMQGLLKGTWKNQRMTYEVTSKGTAEHARNELAAALKEVRAKGTEVTDEEINAEIQEVRRGR
jgi:hypothetical protein